MPPDTAPGRPRGRELVVLIAGLAVAAALVGAALLNLGDPQEAARARAARAARLAGAALAAEWREVARRDAAPPGALGAPVRLGAAADLGPAPPTLSLIHI